MTGGEIVAEVLHRHGVRHLFTLCGGHISPILVACKARGLRVVDTRDEASAVFAADAVARLTGVPGVAAVTAGPGVTNTATAVQNALMAQSPVVVLGGATATLLRGRGSLQDIDQIEAMKPLVKHAAAVQRVRDLAPALQEALHTARSGVPGPVFLEVPVDLLYDRETVSDWYRKGAGKNPVRRLFVARHLDRLFKNADRGLPDPPPLEPPEADARALRKAASWLRKARRPLLVVGSQAVLEAAEASHVAAAVRNLGVPTFLSGMARGLLGDDSPLQFRHRRSQALRQADLVILAGLPQDFRLGYGAQTRGARVVAANRSRRDLRLNRRPDLEAEGDAGRFLQRLAVLEPRQAGRWGDWCEQLRGAEEERDREIARQADVTASGLLNPLMLCRAIEERLPSQSLVVVDGGDFVASASYVLKPRRPLSWLDPGPFGTLGVGGGFALGAALARPGTEVWLLYGDGAAAWSLAELDTFVRHGLSVVAVVGNDASWAQIAREQGEILGDLVGTELRRADYHLVAEGYGARGLLLQRAEDVPRVLADAQETARSGRPVLINAHLEKTDFRKGSLSM